MTLSASVGRAETLVGKGMAAGRAGWLRRPGRTAQCQMVANKTRRTGWFHLTQYMGQWPGGRPVRPGGHRQQGDFGFGASWRGCMDLL